MPGRIVEEEQRRGCGPAARSGDGRSTEIGSKDGGPTMCRILLAFLFLLPDGLTVEEFEKLHRQLQPPKDEAWRSIPWRVSLLEARDQAAREQKPLFIWAMDGHPLACT